MTKEKKTPAKPGEKKTPNKPVADEDSPVVDEPGEVNVVHKDSEKEFTVSREYYLANKGKLKLA